MRAEGETRSACGWRDGLRRRRGSREGMRLGADPVGHGLLHAPAVPGDPAPAAPSAVQPGRWRAPFCGLAASFGGWGRLAPTGAAPVPLAAGRRLTILDLMGCALTGRAGVQTRTRSCPPT